MTFWSNLFNSYVDHLFCDIFVPLCHVCFFINGNRWKLTNWWICHIFFNFWGLKFEFSSFEDKNDYLSYVWVSLNTSFQVYWMRNLGWISFSICAWQLIQFENHQHDIKEQRCWEQGYVIEIQIVIANLLFELWTGLNYKIQKTTENNFKYII